MECGTPWAFNPPAASDECIFDSLVYDNAETDLSIRFNPGALEIGDEIILDASAARYASEFVFEYWGLNSNQVDFVGNVQARVRFYRNDGADFNGYPTPHTLLYDSGNFSLPTTTRSTVTIEDFASEAAVPLLVALPDSFTWTVQFSGLDEGDAAGIDLFSPPIVGANFPDYWENDGSVWRLKDQSRRADGFCGVVPGGCRTGHGGCFQYYDQYADRRNDRSHAHVGGD